jgi:hypothetical protein
MLATKIWSTKNANRYKPFSLSLMAFHFPPLNEYQP